MFASPVQLGRLPWSYDQVWRVYQKAAGSAGIGKVGTHSLRHYAESGTMPHRVLSKLGSAFKSRLTCCGSSSIAMPFAIGVSDCAC
jgi:hypothetical protein